MYAFKDPLGSSDVKIGVTSNPKVRLGCYQTSYSARSHRACFDHVWVGKPTHIDSLEKQLKNKYKWDIDHDGRGRSEWVSDVGIDNIIAAVEEEIKAWHYHVQPLDAAFPVTADDIE